jgi:predicted regulator of Ras-like GTPase activity (Roadblock/LC7/MglB family)
MVAVPVSAVSGNWPEPIKAEIQQLKLSEGTLLVPVEEMGKALKTGKVAFGWGQLLTWTNPSLKTTQGNVTVELALKVVAPLFLAVSKLPTPQKKVEVDPNIPDMFVGKGAPAAPSAPAAEAAPAAAPSPAPAAAPKPAPAPAAAPAAIPAPAVPPSKPAITLKTPAEAVQAVIKLPGIAGAVVASEDGLSVAAQVLPPLAGDKVAAFAPQLFQRTAQYARDLGAGNLEGLTFTCNGAAWRVSKCGKVYLAVVSQPQRPLPLAELAQLERELSKM